MFKFEFSSGNSLTVILWPYLLLLVAGCVISIVIRRKQLKKAVTSFNAGNTDGKFIASCQNLKRVFWSRQSRDVYDMLCCMLAAVQLEQGNEAGFFQNLNSLKGFPPQTEATVYLLFLQYFSGRTHTDIYESYQKQKGDSEEPLTVVRRIVISKSEIQTALVEKKDAFANMLTKPCVIDAFSAFSDMTLN